MKERISVNPNIHFGKPCVAGTRIPVQNVLELIREGLSFQQIIQDYYPDLQIESVRCGRTRETQVQKSSDLDTARVCTPANTHLTPIVDGKLVAQREADVLPKSINTIL
jgi:uncharacterized protein (DUF433 family)